MSLLKNSTVNTFDLSTEEMFNSRPPRPVPDPEPYPGRAHLRQLPAHGPDEPEHGGQQRLVHRHGPRPPLPSLRLCRRLPHQGKHYIHHRKIALRVKVNILRVKMNILKG